MDIKKCTITTGAVFVATFVWDILFHGMFLGPSYYQANAATFVQDQGFNVWLLVGELIQSSLLVYLWTRVMGSFGGGVKGGVQFGVLAQLFLVMPAAMYNHMFINGFPYALSWLWVAGALILGVIQGAIAGAMYKPSMSGRTA